MPNASKGRSRGRRERSAVRARGLSETQRRLLLLLLIMGVAAFLRLYQITALPPGLFADEAMNGNDGLESIETGHFRVFYPQNGGREGLFINIQAGLVYLFGNKAWVLRLPSEIFGTLTVLALYFLARKLFSPAVGLLASFFLATSFWHIMFSRIGMRAASSDFFLVWAAYLLMEGLSRARDGGAYRGRMIAAGAVYGLGFHTYLAYRATPALILPILVYYFVEARNAGWPAAWRKAVAVYAGAAALVVAPLAVYFARNPEEFMHRTAEVSVFRAPRPFLEVLVNTWKMTQMIFFRGDYDWGHNIALRPEVFWPVAIVFALGIALACRAVYQRVRSWFAYAVALLWLVLAAVPAVLSSQNMPNAMRAILMVPAVCILAAVGAEWMYVQLAVRVRPRWLQVGCAAVLLALCYEPYHSYFEVWGTDPEAGLAFGAGGADIAARINAMPKTAAKNVVVVAPGLPPGMPHAVQTVKFLTRSYTQRQQQEINIHYITRVSDSDPDGVAFCEQVGQKIGEGDVFCLLEQPGPRPAF
jgi:4-amino-4-deoxy-L-arabinose transferase-like glycosyltransferase